MTDDTVIKLAQPGTFSDSLTDILRSGAQALLAFYDIPAEHWKHLRTTDEIDKHFFADRGIFRKARTTSRRRAAHLP